MSSHNTFKEMNLTNIIHTHTRTGTNQSDDGDRGTRKHPSPILKQKPVIRLLGPERKREKFPEAGVWNNAYSVDLTYTKHL